MYTIWYWVIWWWYDLLSMLDSLWQQHFYQVWRSKFHSCGASQTWAFWPWLLTYWHRNSTARCACHGGTCKHNSTFLQAYILDISRTNRQTAICWRVTVSCDEFLPVCGASGTVHCHLVWRLYHHPFMNYSTHYAQDVWCLMTSLRKNSMTGWTCHCKPMYQIWTSASFWS